MSSLYDILGVDEQASGQEVFTLVHAYIRAVCMLVLKFAYKISVCKLELTVNSSVMVSVLTFRFGLHTARPHFSYTPIRTSTPRKRPRLISANCVFRGGGGEVVVVCGVEEALHVHHTLRFENFLNWVSMGIDQRDAAEYSILHAIPSAVTDHSLSKTTGNMHTKCLAMKHCAR